MLLCLSDAKLPTASSELKKSTRSQKGQIFNANEKLDTVLSQVNPSENSQQLIANTHSGFQPLARILTEKFDNIQIDDQNFIFREETTENKADERQTSLQRGNQSKEINKKDTVELKPYIH